MKRGALSLSRPRTLNSDGLAGVKILILILVTKLFYYFLFLRRPLAVPGNNFKSNERTLSQLRPTNPE